MDHTVFPPYESFFSRLKNSNIAREDYDHEKKFFEDHINSSNGSSLKIKDFGDYMMYYCEKDVDIMLEATKNMRSLFKAEEGIDPLSLLTAPSIAFTALKKNFLKDEELVSVRSRHLYNHLKRGTFGGQSNVLHRKVEINDSSQECLLELDFSNLYGWCMTQKLPYGKGEIVEGDEKIISFLLNPEKYGLFSIDCSFTDVQKEKLKYWPPIPSKRTIDWNELRYFIPFCVILTK